MSTNPPPPSRFRNWVRHRYRRDDRGISKIQVAVIAGAALILMSPVLLLPLFFAAGPALYNATHSGDNDCGDGSQQPDQSGTAKGDIPRSYLELYKSAGKKYGIPWNVLAGIGKEETNHGRSTLPGVHSGQNEKQAGGPMQFIPGTWGAYGVDGNHDGKKDRYDPADAIPAAARYLKANGAPEKMWNAIWHYNQASWYIEDVLRYAKHYASGDFTIQNDAPSPDCANVELPAGSSAAVNAVIEYARKQLNKPYVWGAEGPDSFDCSGLTMMAYRSIGVNITRITTTQINFGKKVPKGTEQPGDLVFFGVPSAPHHVGLVIGKGKMIEAPHTGASVRISSYKRPDIAGFTRPLAVKGVHPKLA